MAREILLHDAGEDTIHANEITPQTALDKGKNWWYYHKVHLLVGIALIAILASILHSVLFRVEPDYTVALMTSYSMPQVGRSELERCISAYADDRNGDGRVTVSVVNYVFSNSVPANGEEAQIQQGEVTKFIADCSVNQSMIFLHDEEAFEAMKANFDGLFRYNDGSSMPDGANDFENVMRPCSEFSAFSEFTPETAEGEPYTADVLSQLFEKLRISVRDPVGSSIERSEKDMAYYEDSAALYQRLESGEKPAVNPQGREG